MNVDRRCQHLISKGHWCNASATWVLTRKRTKRYYCDDHVAIAKSQSDLVGSDERWQQAEHHARADIQDRPLWCRNLSKLNRGAAHPQAKLTDDQVLWVHRQLAAGRTQRAVARELGVSHVLICHINSGKRWPHLHPTLRKKYRGI